MNSPAAPSTAGRAGAAVRNRAVANAAFRGRAVCGAAFCGGPSPGGLRRRRPAAAGRTIPDLVGPDLRVLFSGINPSLYSAATGHHFARPGNRFWPALHRSGFTPRLLHPSEQESLLDSGLGITNVVARATARADELSPAELVAGGEILAALVEQWQPRFLAVLGVTAYRDRVRPPEGARWACKPRRIAGVPVWVLPNPSGLNAHYTADTLGAAFAELGKLAIVDAVEVERVREAYAAVAGLYIELFGTSGQTHPDDLAFIGRHLSIRPGTVLDLGCGPGHLTDYLRSLGVDATGIDLVPEFIAHAQATHPDGEYRLGSMTDLDAGGRLRRRHPGLVLADPPAAGGPRRGPRRVPAGDGTGRHAGGRLLRR